MRPANSLLSRALLAKTVAVICTGCLAGMIASAATHHLGPVIALGCVLTGAIVALMASVATSPGSAFGRDQRRGGSEQS